MIQLFHNPTDFSRYFLRYCDATTLEICQDNLTFELHLPIETRIYAGLPLRTCFVVVTQQRLLWSHNTLTLVPSKRFPDYRGWYLRIIPWFETSSELGNLKNNIEWKKRWPFPSLLLYHFFTRVFIFVFGGCYWLNFPCCIFCRTVVILT